MNEQEIRSLLIDCCQFFQIGYGIVFGTGRGEVIVVRNKRPAIATGEGKSRRVAIQKSDGIWHTLEVGVFPSTVAPSE